MHRELRVIELSIDRLIYGLLGVAFVWAMALCLRRVLGSDRAGDHREETGDWSIPAADSLAHGHSFLHRWDPRIKIVALLFFIFCTASLTHLTFAGAALLLAACTAAIIKVPVRRVAGRLAAMATFLGMILLVIPLTVPAKEGDTVVIFSGLPFLAFNAGGFRTASLICLKAVGIAFLTDPLLSTSPLLTTMQALARLGVPAAACRMFLLTHRYAFVFQEEAMRVSTGLRVRGFWGKTDLETLRTLGNFLGMLLVRSFERTERVYDAMLARGYNGGPLKAGEFLARPGDWVLGFLWVLAGFTLVGLDRFCAPVPFDF